MGGHATRERTGTDSAPAPKARPAAAEDEPVFEDVTSEQTAHASETSQAEGERNEE